MYMLVAMVMAGVVSPAGWIQRRPRFHVEVAVPAMPSPLCALTSKHMKVNTSPGAVITFHRFLAYLWRLHHFGCVAVEREKERETSSKF